MPPPHDSLRWLLVFDLDSSPPRMINGTVGCVATTAVYHINATFPRSGNGEPRPRPTLLRKKSGLLATGSLQLKLPRMLARTRYCVRRDHSVWRLRIRKLEWWWWVFHLGPACRHALGYSYYGGYQHRSQVSRSPSDTLGHRNSLGR